MYALIGHAGTPHSILGQPRAFRQSRGVYVTFTGFILRIRTEPSIHYPAVRELTDMMPEHCPAPTQKTYGYAREDSCEN